VSYDPTDKAGFEKWATGQGMNLEPVGAAMRTRGGVALPTYFEDATEFAWRGWANRPHRTTHAGIATTWPTPADAERKVRLPSTFEPLPEDAYHGRPRFPSAPTHADAGKTLKHGAHPRESDAFEWTLDNGSKLTGPFVDAVRKLVDRLPKDEFNTARYYARDELLAVRALLGEKEQEEN
jgi:hypothetical protein